MNRWCSIENWVGSQSEIFSGSILCSVAYEIKYEIHGKNLELTPVYYENGGMKEDEERKWVLEKVKK